MKSSGAGSEFAGASVADAAPLAPLTTLRVGPTARRLITCATSEQVITTLGRLDAETPGGQRDSVLVFAGGSNLVMSDALTDLTAVRLANDGITVEGNVVRAQAGAMWDDVVVTAIEHGLGGLECLSGIPGSAGATPVQNVGAYGADAEGRPHLVDIARRRFQRARGLPLGTPVVLVGDTPRDVEAALTSGAHIIAVATGVDSPSVLAAAGAPVVLPDLADTDRVLRLLEDIERDGNVPGTS